jgi:hypothetical protein
MISLPQEPRIERRIYLEDQISKRDGIEQFSQFQQTSQVQDGQMAPIEMEDTSIPRWEVDRVERGKKEMGA